MQRALLRGGTEHGITQMFKTLAFIESTGLRVGIQHFQPQEAFAMFPRATDYLLDNTFPITFAGRLRQKIEFMQ
jgi:hypothetical protein